MKTTITIYNISVCIESNDYTLLEHLRNFIDRFYTSKSKSFNSSSDINYKVFACKLNNYSVYYLHVNQFVHFYNQMKSIGYNLDNVERIDKRDYDIIPANFSVKNSWVLRDYQKDIMDFILNDPTKSKLIPLQTGSGKTIISLYTIAQLKQRLGIVILPTYIDKWISDIISIYDIDNRPSNTSDIMVIQGSKSLKCLIELAKMNNLNNNFYIFSNRTMQEYISYYENDPEECVEAYGCSPIELFPLLGIGVLLIDETHQHFHSIFKILINTNVKLHIGLSATLLSDDPIVRNIHKLVYTEKNTYKQNGLDKYADVYSISYTINEKPLKLIKTKNYGSEFYSHIAFEQSILRNSHILNNYKDIIITTIDDYYISEYQENDKLLIFVSTINMATTLTDYIRSKYGNYIVNRYCEEDPYENLIESDIIVSTIISSGTAVDIPNLRVVIQTVSISSQVSNIQSLGRLRKLKDRDVKFCCLYSPNISKQKEYNMKRMELFKNRVANIIYRQSRISIN